MSLIKQIKKTLTISVISAVAVIACSTTNRSNPAPIESGLTSEQLKKLSERTNNSQNVSRVNSNTNKKAQQTTKAEDESAVEVSALADAPVAAENKTVAHCPGVRDGFLFPLTSWTIYKQFTPELKGIDVKSKYGSPIYASKAGKVVYSGDGLVGYGNVIIVKHEDGALTAYAFNKANLVKVGEQVKQCQKIAEVGYMYKQISGLHFEIRKSGKPLSPLSTITNK